MSSVLNLIRHYQSSIEKNLHDEERLLRCLKKLFHLDVTVAHLQETGVGRTVNALRKEPGNVGVAAKTIVSKWKQVVIDEEMANEDVGDKTGTTNGETSSDNDENNTNNSDQYSVSSSSNRESHSSRVLHNDQQYDENNTERINSESDKPNKKDSKTRDSSNSDNHKSIRDETKSNKHIDEASHKKHSSNKDVKKNRESHSKERNREHSSHSNEKKLKRRNSQEREENSSKRRRDCSSSEKSIKDSQSELKHHSTKERTNRDKNKESSNRDQARSRDKLKDEDKQNSDSLRTEHRINNEHSRNEHKSNGHSSKSKHKSSRERSKESKRSSSKSSDDVSKKNICNPSPDTVDNEGIDCESGTSFAAALGMISPVKAKKKKTEKEQTMVANKPTISLPLDSVGDMSPSTLLAPSAILSPLPPLEIAGLPEISPNYKPRPAPKLLPGITEEEALNVVMSSKNQRTKVYSGNKSYGFVPSLYDLCIRILEEHIDSLEYTGGVPYELLKPVVDKATPEQLMVLEYHNPYFLEETDHLWKKHVEKNFRRGRRQEMETWREMFLRCKEEQEERLRSLTANIKMADARKVPTKTTKMAYVDSVVKPPRSIARKQALHGTARVAVVSPAARVAALATSNNVFRAPEGSGLPARSSISAPTTSSSSNKPKKAPLMQKALQFMRGRKR